MTHCRLPCEKPRSLLIDGSATLTIATSRMTMNWAVTIRARALQRRVLSVGRRTNLPPKSLFISTVYMNNDNGATLPLMTEVAPQPLMERFPEELVSSALFLLKRLGMTAKERSLDAYQETGLHPYHHAILAVLDEGSRETQGAIAKALGYDKAQLVGLLDELEQAGLVERRRDPDDRRRQLV